QQPFEQRPWLRPEEALRRCRPVPPLAAVVVPHRQRLQPLLPQGPLTMMVQRQPTISPLHTRTRTHEHGRRLTHHLLHILPLPPRPRPHHPPPPPTPADPGPRGQNFLPSTAAATTAAAVDVARRPDHARPLPPSTTPATTAGTPPARPTTTTPTPQSADAPQASTSSASLPAAPANDATC